MRALWKGACREESDWQGRKAQQVIACKALWDLLFDDGKDVDIRSCAKSFDRPSEAFA